MNKLMIVYNAPQDIINKPNPDSWQALMLGYIFEPCTGTYQSVHQHQVTSQPISSKNYRQTSCLRRENPTVRRPHLLIKHLKSSLASLRNYCQYLIVI